MADREDNRNKKREEDDCQDPVNIPSRQGPPERSAKDCDDPLIAPEEDKFLEPTPCPPAPAPELVVPDPLIIENNEASSACPLLPDKPGNVGTPVVVPAGTFRDFFNFGSIERINTNQLTYIAGLTEAQRDQLADPATPVSTISAITKLDAAQAAFINEQVTALQVSVDDIAQVSAEGQLNCLFFNETQSVTCDSVGFPTNAYTNTNVPSGQEGNVNNPSEIAAGIYSSANSQEEADEIAEDVAEGALKCYYGNDEVVVTCLDIGFGESVPNDVEPAISADGRLRVGTVTIPADTIYSNSSRDAATSLATTLAQSQLTCFYLNTQVNLSCESIGKEGTVAPPANVPANQSGNPVQVEPGFITSSVSTADANAQALSLATSLLECYWVNDEQCATCPTEEVTNPDDPDGPPFYIEAEEPGPLCVAPGTTRSYVSQEDANEQASILASAQLICIYCNPPVNPKCVHPDWSGIIPVPPEEITEDWSVSATRGAAGGSICSSAASDVVGVGVSIGNTPADITDSTDCCYGNAAVTAACENDVDGQPVDAALSSAPVVIAANTLIVCDSDAEEAGWEGTTKEYATQLAQQLADAALVCIWSNEEITVECPLPAGDDILVGVGEVTVSAGLYISFKSKAEADSIAETVALAQLNCIYCNYGNENGTTQECPPNTVFLGQPIITQCAVQSAVSSQAASDIADAMSDAGRICVPQSSLGTPGADGQDGADGAQTSCSGNCYGYFS